MLQDLLEKREDLRRYLFIRGFLITNDTLTLDGGFPFYDNFNVQKLGSYTFCVQKLQTLYHIERDGKFFYMIGHAYNPYTMDADENVILNKLADGYAESREKSLEVVNQLTGIFVIGYIDGERMELLNDASGMQYVCYGVFDGKLYLSSHMQLVQDLKNMEVDPYIRRLINYRWYRYVFGNYFAGDLTKYKELKRVVPNTYVTFDGKETSITRFYPNKEIEMCKDETEYREVIEKAAELMKNNMKLIAQKWDRAGISLSGGVDSNTTLAAANGIYDKFTSFSYVALDYEVVDANAADIISDAVGIKHTRIPVPSQNSYIKDFDAYRAILAHNDGYIGRLKENDLRKKIVLMNRNVCDIEVKSWISETIRAYAYKYYGRKKFPKNMRPRNYTALYKMFFFRRPLVWKTDKAFAKYIKDTKLKEHLYNYDESDFYVWEMMHGGKCSMNIGTMRFCFDITIPYNNRNLLDLLLRVDLQDRLSDRHHMDMKAYLNKELADLNICVANQNQTENRKKLLNAVYKINTLLPF